MKKAFVNNFKDKILRFIHKSIYKPGHYYSAVPDPAEIERRKDQIYRSRRLPELNYNVKGQLSFLEETKAFLSSFPYLDESYKETRYRRNNGFYGLGDALCLFLVMKNFSPRKIVEVGSGFSSAAMLDFNERFFNSEVKLHFIEPYPDRLNSILRAEDRQCCEISQKFVQDMPLEEFSKLDENDILFIDSSHVSKIGSDVNFLFFEVLPMLKPGVIIHIHDIFHQFEYPKFFIDYGIYWNEAYFVRAFLAYNQKFEILLHNDFLVKERMQKLVEIDPMLAKIGGGSLWLRKK